MKKIIGFLTLAVLVVFGCTPKDEYVPAEKEAGAQYFFPVGTPDYYKIAEDVEGFDFTIKRIVKDAAKQLTIEVRDTSLTVFPEEYTEISVNFAAGEDEAKITLPIDYSKYEYGDKYGLWISILEETTVYAPSSLHIEIELPEPWVSLGKGTWVSSWLFEDTFEDVEFFQNEVQPNHFRFAYAEAICNQYTGEKPEDWPEFFEFWILKPGDVLYNTLTITQENLVTWNPLFDTGYYVSSYGLNISAVYPTALYIVSGGYYNIGTEENVLNSRVEYYQDENPELPAVVSLAPVYYMFQPDGSLYGGWTSTWQSANVKLVFPGVVLADYTAEVEYTGLYNKADGDVFAVADVTLGMDVEYARVAIVAGADDEALEEAVDLILDEETESDYVLTVKPEDLKTIDVVIEEEKVKFMNGEIRLPLPEISEDYAIVIVPFGGGKAQLADATFDAFEYKDFGISVTLAEPETGEDGLGHITATVGFGEDTEAAFVVMAPGKDEAALKAALNLILSGDDSVVMIDKPGDVDFDIESEGDFLVMAVSYAAESLWNLDYAFFEYYAVDPWETMGYIYYTDDAVLPLFSGPAVSYWVPIQKNINEEGLYRLVNPYHEAFPYNDPGDWDDSTDHNLVIDATDPDVVLIPAQNLGVDWGYGFMYLASLGWRYLDAGYSYEDIIAGAGDVFGKLADNKITFPAKTLSIMDDDGWYQANKNGAFLLDLSDIRETNPDEEESPAPRPFSHSRKGGVKSNLKPIKGEISFPRTLKSAAVSVARGKVVAASRHSEPTMR